MPSVICEGAISYQLYCITWIFAAALMVAFIVMTIGCDPRGAFEGIVKLIWIRPIAHAGTPMNAYEVEAGSPPTVIVAFWVGTELSIPTAVRLKRAGVIMRRHP